MRDILLANFYHFVFIFTAAYCLVCIALLSGRYHLSRTARAFALFLGSVFLWSLKDFLTASLRPYLGEQALLRTAIALSPLFLCVPCFSFHLMITLYNSVAAPQNRFRHGRSALYSLCAAMGVIYVLSLAVPSLMYAQFTVSSYDYRYVPGIACAVIAAAIMAAWVMPAVACIIQSRTNPRSEAFLIPLGGLISCAVIFPSNILALPLGMEHMPRLGALSMCIMSAVSFYALKRYGAAFSVRRVLEERDKLQMIGDSLASLAGTTTDREICQHVCDYAQEISDSLFVCIVVFSDDCMSYEIRGASYSTQALKDTVFSRLPLSPGSRYRIQAGSVFARQIMDCEPYECRSVQEFYAGQLDEEAAAQLTRAGNIRQIISYPIILDRVPKGCVVLFRTSPAENIDLYRIFSAQCALALKFSTHIQDIEEKRRLEEMLYQSQKMDALGQLAGGMAHDLNNMLAGISGYIDIIRRTFAQKEPKLASYIETITNATEKASDLIGKLLAFARKGTYQLVPVNVHAVVSEVIQLLERTIDKRIQILQNLTADPPMIMGDPTQIQNALINLALNARDAMPDGGTLTFQTSTTIIRQDDTRSVRFSMKSGEYLILQVKDTGTGMDRETLAHIYEPFFTTKEVGKGTGLGLSSVYGCVKNHNGYIHADSEVGTGTIFTVYLPLLREAQPAAVKPPRGAVHADVSPAAEKGKGHIVVVDDEPIVRQLYQTILNDFGYQVTAFGEAKEAVEFYRRNHAAVDCVIIDMIMPRMNGSECFTEMHKINPHVKAILATGYDVSERTQKVLTKGISGFLQKPFKENTLLKMVADVLNTKGPDAPKQPLRG